MIKFLGKSFDGTDYTVDVRCDENSRIAEVVASNNAPKWIKRKAEFYNVTKPEASHIARSIERMMLSKGELVCKTA